MNTKRNKANPHDSPDECLTCRVPCNFPSAYPLFDDICPCCRELLAELYPPNWVRTDAGVTASMFSGLPT